jgi:signal recognition particle subunit SRP54
LSEADVEAALKDVRVALLEADVHFRVVKTFLEEVRRKAIGLEVRESLTPGQQIIKVVWEELRRLMGGGASENGRILFSKAPPTVLMLVGLQGAGKTTTAGKLAKHFKGEGRRVLLAACDPRRPAAVDQLVSLGRQIGVEVQVPDGADALAVCRAAADRGRVGGYDLVILDTAGRLHIQEELMNELSTIKRQVVPHENLLVADAMTGQDAVRIAEHFHQAVGLTGVILTKLDGDARGGALLSIRSVTGLPVKYVGVGEKLDALEPFHPDRMASRILGMGDVLTLIERAEKAFTQQGVSVREGYEPGRSFTLEDFRDQIRKFKKIGSFEQVLGMLPGGGRLKETMDDQALSKGERELVRLEAIINSMTARERRDPSLINGSRRRRIALGSGTTVQEVNRLLRRFMEIKKLMKSLSRRQGKLEWGQLLRTF